MYFTIVTQYAYSKEIKGYSYYAAEAAMDQLIRIRLRFRDEDNANDILLITDKFYDGDNVDMSIFDRSN